MAIGTPTLQQTAGATAATVTTASFTPNANTRLFAWGISWRSGATPNDPAITDSLSSSWTAITGSKVSFLSGSTDNVVGQLFYLDIGSSPSAMTVTCAATSSNRMSVATFEISGGQSDFSNMSTATSGTGDMSCPALSAFAGTSIGVGLGAAVGNNNFTPPSGYTELYDAAPGITRRLTVVYDMTSPGTTLTWSSNNTDSVAVAFEYKEASSGGSTSVAANPGSYSVSGTAATLKYGHLVSSVAGSYAIGGTAATLKIGKGVEANGGSYAITGAAAALLRARVNNADGSSYAISGAVANPVVGRRVVAGSGVYAVAGGAATFVKGFGLPANGGTYTINGTAAALRSTHKLIADPNSYLVIGAAVLLHYSGAGSGSSGAGLILDRRRRR